MDNVCIIEFKLHSRNLGGNRSQLSELEHTLGNATIGVLAYPDWDLPQCDSHVNKLPLIIVETRY